MPQNGIRMEGIEALARGLAQCPNLEHLDLQDNTAARKGTRAIVARLHAWPQLRHLNLSDCLLGKAGGIALASRLQDGSNPLLESLKLQYNEMDKRTFEILAVAVAQHLKDLEVLELNGNQVDEDDDAIEQIKNALKEHDHEDALDDREWRLLFFADKQLTTSRSPSARRSPSPRPRRRRKRRPRPRRRRHPRPRLARTMVLPRARTTASLPSATRRPTSGSKNETHMLTLAASLPRSPVFPSPRTNRYNA
jgi:hypothetical protein